MGRSLGGAVAIHTASKFSLEIQGCIVENSFLSIPILVNGMGPFFIKNKLFWLKNLFLKSKWKSNEAIKLIECPTLFISGLRD